jgi:glyoxylase I family protein
MKIEHAAFLVSDPVAMASWYREHLGMKVVRSTGAPSFTHFLADSVGSVMIEVYRNDHLAIPDYRSFDPLVVHVAFAADDLEQARTRLLRAGATAEGEITVSPNGDQLAMLRDPWGLPVQLARRKVPMV